MTANSQGSRTSPVKLLPHQASFVDLVFAPSTKKFTLLRGQVGLGKGTVLVAIAARLLEQRPNARILLLSPAALRAQFIERLSLAGTPAIRVDRFYYRELLDVSTGGDIWPHGLVVVLSSEFAKQPDIQDSLASASWDLVIVDEAHQMAGVRARTLRMISAHATRIVLSTMPNLGPPEGVSVNDVTVVDWQWETLVNHDGTRIQAPSAPLLDVVPFRLAPAELSLLEAVSALAARFETVPDQNWFARSLHTSLQSSPAALERVLDRPEFGRGPESSFEPDLEIGDDVADGGEVSQLPPRLVLEGVSALTAQVLQAIEANPDDTKLAEFCRLLSRLGELGSETVRRICVITGYTATSYYIAAELEGRAWANQLIHGGMNTKARREALGRFLTDGGVLVATRAVMTAGLDPEGITDLVLYDIPQSREQIRQVLGRVDRFGRVGQLTVHALVPTNVPDGLKPRGLRILEEALAAE